MISNDDSRGIWKELVCYCSGGTEVKYGNSSVMCVRRYPATGYGFIASYFGMRSPSCDAHISGRLGFNSGGSGGIMHYVDTVQNTFAFLCSLSLVVFWLYPSTCMEMLFAHIHIQNVLHPTIILLDSTDGPF
jgi:hypothetical protein